MVMVLPGQYFIKLERLLKKRDDVYKLKYIIELDRASFGKRHTGNQEKTLDNLAILVF